MTDHNERACTSCGSLLCRRGGECPTCSVCGRRGHLACTLPAIAPPAPTNDVEVAISIGADLELRQVVTVLEIRGAEKPIKVKLCWTQEEAGRIAMQIVNEAAKLGRTSRVAIPPKARGAAPLLKLPPPRGAK